MWVVAARWARVGTVQAFDDVFQIAAFLDFATVLPDLFLRRPSQEREEGRPARAVGAEPRPAD